MSNYGSLHREESYETVGIFGCMIKRVQNFFRKFFNDVVDDEPEEEYSEQVEHLKQVFRDNIIEKTLDFEDILQESFKPCVSFVIDASVTSVKNIRAVLKKICEEPDLSEFKIILTSVTVRELQMLQAIKDSDGNDATFIMNHALDYGKTYRKVRIAENGMKPDDCIVRYCAGHKNVVLLTSDKEMALNANSYHVHVLFLKQQEGKKQGKAHNGIVSLYPTRKIGDQLFTGEMQTAKRSMLVITPDGKEFSQNICELHVGDNILIASLREDCLIFVVYNLISLSTENNAQTIFNRRYYATDEIDNLENVRYQEFLREFIRKHKINF